MDPNLAGIIGLAALMVVLVAWLRADMNERMDRLDTAQAEPPGRIETIPSGHNATLSGIDATLSDHGERLTRIVTVQAEQGERLARIEATLSEHGATDWESEVDEERLLPEAAAPGGKYAPLYRHLSARRDARWLASFGEIEAILGFPLPASARRHRAWWANGGHSQAEAWLAAGWRIRSVDFGKEKLVFEHKDPARPDPDDEGNRWE